MNQGSVNASIITIGDELLIGQTIDTNSAWMGQELNKIGIWIQRRVAVGDLKEEIMRALDEEALRSDIVFLTGGLGPTADDITKPVLCEYFGGKLVIDERSLTHIRYLFEQLYNRKLTERNLRQAEVPDNCRVLFNEDGSAPGMWFEKGNTVFISLPGVPQEMKSIMLTEVLPVLTQRFAMPIIIHQTLMTGGIGESYIADLIQDWESSLPPHIKMAYLPNYNFVRLRLTIQGQDRNKLEEELEKKFAELKSLVAQWMIADEDMTVQEIVARLLKERKETVSTTESCTGGYIAHLLTMNPGASSNYKGSVISYDNAVKQDILGVSPASIKKHGAVSEEIVRQMVSGGLKKLKSDYVIATSGIMGPDGGTENKKVGTVWIAVGNNNKTVAREFWFRFDRIRNIEQTAQHALNMLRRLILEQQPK